MVVTIKHLRYDVVHYIVLSGRVVASEDSGAEVYKKLVMHM